MTILSPREVPLGGLRAMTVRRTLPNRHRSTIGAWCFVDHFGPNQVADVGGMVVAAHPHTGLQTVTWLFEGEVEHRDSLGHQQLIEPGQVNLMTAGRGISHAEVSTHRVPVLHGAQLWVALRDEDRHMEPFFEHHQAVPVNFGPARALVFVGTLGGVTASTTTFTALVGAEITAPAHSVFVIPLEPSCEHGVLVDAGNITVNGEAAVTNDLAYCDAGEAELRIEVGDQPARLLLLGGEPFEEELVMWWNFIGRSHEDIEQMREQWQHDVIDGNNGNGIYGSVDIDLVPIPAPEMPKVRLRARR